MQRQIEEIVVKMKKKGQLVNHRDFFNSYEISHNFDNKY
jgi:hypothetical protein